MRQGHTDDQRLGKAVPADTCASLSVQADGCRCAQGAATLYLQAVEIIMENDGKAAMAGDTFRTAIGESLIMTQLASSAATDVHCPCRQPVAHAASH